MQAAGINSSSMEENNKKEIDGILDAALDELDIDSDDDSISQVNVEADTKIETNEIDKKYKKSKAKGINKKNIDEEMSESAIESSLEEMMNQLFQISEQFENEGYSDNDTALEEMINHLQSQIAPISVPKDKESKKKKKKVSNGSEEVKSKETSTSNDGTGVNRTVEKLLSDMAQVGGSEEGAEAAQMEQIGEEMMESMMKEFEKMGQKGDADDVIDGMMRQLLSKELMYEPMKQVTERFPRWLAESKPHLSEEDYNRYGNQYQYFQRILAVYEKDPNNFPRLMELMQDIQEYGQPPADIIKELAPELEFDEEGMPKMDMDMPGMPFPNGQCSIM